MSVRAPKINFKCFKIISMRKRFNFVFLRGIYKRYAPKLHVESYPKRSRVLQNVLRRLATLVRQFKAFVKSIASVELKYFIYVLGAVEVNPQQGVVCTEKMLGKINTEAFSHLLD